MHDKLHILGRIHLSVFSSDQLIDRTSISFLFLFQYLIVTSDPLYLSFVYSRHVLRPGHSNFGFLVFANNREDQNSGSTWATLEVEYNLNFEIRSNTQSQQLLSFYNDG